LWIIQKSKLGKIILHGAHDPVDRDLGRYPVNHPAAVSEFDALDLRSRNEPALPDSGAQVSASLRRCSSGRDGF